MKKLLLLPLGVLLFAFSRDTRRAEACGGPSMYMPAILAAPALLEWTEDTPRAETTFLYPFKSAYPQEAAVAWKFAYERLEHAPAPDTRALESALGAGDLGRARKEARQVIESWYALPPVLAAPHRPVLERALSVLEPKGSASASRAFFDLMDDFRKRVPDGWSDGVRKQVPASLWSEQLSATRRWQSANPNHPLRDLAELWQVRIHFFAGDYDAAYQTLFRLYPRRRVRALAEMRYLAQQGRSPSPAELDAVGDALLLASFAGAQPITPERWKRWWALSEKAPRRAAGIALQERLLQAVVRQPANSSLPAAFPERAAAPSQYWGKLRAVALMHRGRHRDAEEQLALLAPDNEQATLLAGCILALGDPVRAARVTALGGDDVHFIVQVLTPRAELAKLRSDPMLHGHAESALAADLVQSGDLLGAARMLKASNPERAAELERLAKLRQSGDKLALARAWRALGTGDDPGVYRGFSLIHSGYPADSAEARNIVAYLEASSGAFQSLAPYVAWLETHATAKNARAVLTEADRAYIALTAYGSGRDLFWAKYLERHELIVRLRRVGKHIRSAQRGR